MAPTTARWASTSSFSPDHVALHGARQARQDRAMPCKSAPPAVHVFAAACLTESHLSHLIPLNPGESRPKNVFRARRRPSPLGEMGGCAQPRNGDMLVLNRVEPAPIEAKRCGTARRDHEVSTGMSRRSGGTHAGGMRRPSDRHVGCGYSRPAAANTASRAPDDYSCRRRCRGTGRRVAAGRPSRRDQGVSTARCRMASAPPK